MNPPYANRINALNNNRKESPVENGFEATFGVKLVSLVFAFLGAALGITYTPEMTKRLAFAALLSGMLCGSFGPEVVNYFLATPLRPVLNNAIAVIFGIGGMFIIPGLMTFWRGFGTDPWGWLDKLRGIKKDGSQP